MVLSLPLVGGLVVVAAIFYYITRKENKPKLEGKIPPGKYLEIILIII